ncbi:proton-conducting transporter membrane subunit [Pseudomonas aeruginosa]
MILNLVGSAFFLIAVGTLYGLTGTLNMADMAQKIAAADAERALLAAPGSCAAGGVRPEGGAVAAVLLAAARAYAAASAPVAALFAIIDQGRHLLDPAGLHAGLRRCRRRAGNLAQAWLWPLALATLGLGAIGALAARTLQSLLAYLVVVSAGTLLAGVALGSERAGGVAYYLLHSTWIAGGLFLLADLVARQRGDKAGDLVQARRCRILGARRGFLHRRHRRCRSAAIVGVLRQGHAFAVGRPGSQALALWSVVLGSGLVALVALEPGRQHAVLAHRAYRAR